MTLGLARLTNDGYVLILSLVKRVSPKVIESYGTLCPNRSVVVLERRADDARGTLPCIQTAVGRYKKCTQDIAREIGRERHLAYSDWRRHRAFYRLRSA